MATVGCLHCNSTNLNYYLAYPSSGSGQATHILLSPNGGKIYLKSLTDRNTTTATLTSTYTFYPNSSMTSEDTGSGYVEFYAKYEPPSGKKLKGIETIAGNYATGVSYGGWSNDAVLTISFTGLQNGGCLAVQLTWEDAGGGGGGTSYSAPGAPSGVRVGSSTSYGSNTNSNTNVSWTGSSSDFYITWPAGTPGTNNPITGYQRRVIYASDNSVVNQTTATTTSLYSRSYDYSSGMKNIPLKGQVRTVGTASTGYTYSNWVTSTNTITFRGPSYTIAYNANGGTGTTTSQTKWEGENITLRGALTRAQSTSPSTTTYTTSFNVNNGASSTPSSLTNTKTVTTTTKYTFDKWRAGSTTGTAYSAGGTYSTDASTTMYATWTTSSSTTTGTTSITLPTYTLKAGYYDGEPGWFTAPTGGTKVGNAGQSYTPTSNGTLYLHPWKCCYVYDGSWKKAIPYVYNSNSWKRCEPYVYNNSTWK